MTSPGWMPVPSMSWSRLTMPTQKPARSKSLPAVHAGQLRRLAAEEGGARLLAPGGDAADDGRGRVDRELAGGVVVEEEEGFGTLHDDVVRAHGDEVDADGVVAVEFDGELELRADAVRARDEHRAWPARQVDFEEPAEAADAAQDARPVRAAGQWLDVLHQGVTRIDVDAGILVGQGLFRGHGFRLATRRDWRIQGRSEQGWL